MLRSAPRRPLHRRCQLPNFPSTSLVLPRSRSRFHWLLTVETWAAVLEGKVPILQVHQLTVFAQVSCSSPRAVHQNLQPCEPGDYHQLKRLRLVQLATPAAAL